MDDAKSVAASERPEGGLQEPEVAKVVVLQSYMEAELEEAAVEIAQAAVQRSRRLKEIAEIVKKGFDDRFPPQTSLDGVYHCIAGQHFATCITHDTRCFIHLQVGRVHVVVFRSKDLPFDPNFKPSAQKKAEEKAKASAVSDGGEAAGQGRGSQARGGGGGPARGAGVV